MAKGLFQISSFNREKEKQAKKNNKLFTDEEKAKITKAREVKEPSVIETRQPKPVQDLKLEKPVTNTPKGVCPICHGLKHIKTPTGYKPCECKILDRINSIIAKSEVPEIFKQFNPDLKTKEQKQFAISLKSVLEGNSYPLFFLYSSTFNKEKMAVVAIRGFLRNKKYSQIGWQTLDDLVSYSFNDHDKFAELSNRDILVVLIGAEEINAAHKSVLYNFLYNRILSAKPTIIVSLFKINQLASNYSPNVFNLINNNFLIFEV